MIATQDSTSLLRRYACDGSEDAFAELASRHLDLVYSAAARCCRGDEALAGDVAQRVFVDLARKFRPEGRGTISAAEGIRSVPAWLHRHTCFVAASAIRSESRRRLREMHAMELQPQGETGDWSRVAPVLEEALSELPDPDRDAVVLRFFEDEPYARIGSALECSEDAARMRVDRALDRLRAALEKRGVTSTSGALAALILANAVIPAPTGMAASISAGTCAVPAGSGAAHLLASKPLVFGFAASVLVGVLTLGWVGDRLRTGQLRLAQANAALRAELESLRSSIPQSTSAADLAELERLRREHDELLRLRGEVARLRRELGSRPDQVAAPAPPEKGAEEATDPPIQLAIEAKFIELADEDLEDLNLNWLNSGGTSVMVPGEFRRIQDLVQQLPGIEVLAAPTVTTLNGRQARIRIVPETKDSVPDREPGEELALDAIPVLDKATGIIELTLRGGRMPRPQPSPGEGKGGGTVAIPQKAPPFATTSVHDGWGFVLRRPGMPSSSDTPRSLLILGTVVQIDPAGNRVFPADGEK